MGPINRPEFGTAALANQCIKVYGDDRSAVGYVTQYAIVICDIFAKSRQSKCHMVRSVDDVDENETSSLYGC